MHIGEYVNGGVNTYINEVLKYQTKKDDTCQIYVYASKKKSDKVYNESTKINTVYYKYSRSMFHLVKMIFYFRKKIKILKPDIIHIHSTFAGFFVRCALFTIRSKSKVIYCSHGWSFLMDTSNFKKKIYIICEKILSLCTDKIINISIYEHNQACKVKLPTKKMLLINNGISEKKLDNNKKSNASIKMQSKKIKVLFVGRLDKQKGIDILLKFVMKYKNQNFHFYIIGNSVLDNQYIEFPSNTSYLGKIDNSYIDDYYQASDVVIIPSRWEGFGLVAIEAMKNKKAIIVSNRGALPELVNNDNGFVFDIDNIQSLENIFNNLEKKELQNKGANGYQYFIDNYTSNEMNKKIYRLYNKLLNREGYN
ncbi:glycosyltransferase [Terrilactibacillus sp. BCM23-1]|uniref:Glycosyltransferase n=2 Tax=Terrilactibacillus tamarindi TaxID=2599694 RepID=A0A6N8CSH9_9BACI|nr:glycosyltransferase [Terrilactibacillus tamarindi]